GQRRSFERCFAEVPPAALPLYVFALLPRRRGGAGRLGGAVALGGGRGGGGGPGGVARAVGRAAGAPGAGGGGLAGGGVPSGCRPSWPARTGSPSPSTWARGRSRRDWASSLLLPASRRARGAGAGC